MRKVRKWEGEKVENVEPPFLFFTATTPLLHTPHSLPHTKQQGMNIRDLCRDLCLH